jgi:hypothetical protein
MKPRLAALPLGFGFTAAKRKQPADRLLPINAASSFTAAPS